MKKYAGIGSRETPEEVLKNMTNIASILEEKGYVLCSGGAEGADKAFAKGVKLKSNMEIYVPWRGFNAIDTKLTEASEKAHEIAEKFHPVWDRLSDGAKKLQARNSHILLGEDCEQPVDFVICWTLNGKVVGGTGQGLRIAQYYKIPIYNLAIESNVQSLLKFIQELK